MYGKRWLSRILAGVAKPYTELPPCLLLPVGVTTLSLDLIGISREEAQADETTIYYIHKAIGQSSKQKTRNPIKTAHRFDLSTYYIIFGPFGIDLP